MDKQELENRVLNPGINNNITINGKNYTREDKVLSLIDQLDESEITTEQAWEKIAEEYKLPVETVQQIAGTTISSAVKKEDIAIRDGRIILNPNLTEPEKQEIPHWLAERIEEYNIDSSIEFWRYVFNGSIFNPGERVWILDNDDIINKIFLYGYTIEKEHVWVVKTFAGYLTKFETFVNNNWRATTSNSKDDKDIITFECKEKANEIATLVDGAVEEWSE